MLTKNDFEAIINTGKSVSATTKKTRVYYLWKLYRDIGADSKDLSFLADYNAVIKKIRESDKPDVKKTRLFHILSILDTPSGKVVNADIKKRYRDMANKLRDQARVEAMDNTMTEKAQERYMSLDGSNTRLENAIVKLFADYELPRGKKISDADFAKWDVQSDRKNIKTFARDLQRCMIVACYVWQPSLRSDWGTLEITGAAANRLTTDKNWLQVLRTGRMRIIMNQYKNAKSMGQQIIEVESAKLKGYLKYWIDLIGRVMGQKTTHLFWYELSAKKNGKFNDNRSTFTKCVSRCSDSVLGRPLSVNDYRHMHEMAIQSTDEYKRATMAERAEMHRKLLHGTMMGQQYAYVRRDANTDSNEA